MKTFTFWQSVIALLVVFGLFLFVSYEDFTEKQISEKLNQEVAQDAKKDKEDHQRIYDKINANGAYMTGFRIVQK